MAPPEERYRVEVTVHDEIVCLPPTGAEQRIRVRDLGSVHVETNASGPLGADVWWVLKDAQGRTCVRFPQLASGEGAVLDRLRMLPGFRPDGMNSAEPATFRCWSQAESA